MHRPLVVLLAFCLVPFFVQAQERLVVENYCSYDGAELEDDVYTFQSDQEAWASIERVLRFAGLEPNFRIRAGNVPNAMAVINPPERMIIYNQQFMIQVGNIDSDWAAISILAHELAHHLQGHTLRPGGSRPELELQADKWSGFILFQMGATLEQAQAAMRQLANPQGSPTHPGRSARLAAISNGWLQGRDVADESPGAPNPEPEPQEEEERRSRRTIPNDGPEAEPFEARIVFANNPAAFFLSSSNEVIMIAPTGERAIVGRRIPPTAPGFAWMLDTGSGAYGVTANGQIINRTPWGAVFQVGYVTTVQ